METGVERLGKQRKQKIAFVKVMLVLAYLATVALLIKALTN
jgi:hypothetical protein